MIIVSTSKGFTLVFESLGELEGTINNLIGQSEFVQENAIEPPFLYNVHDARIPSGELDEFLNKLKSSGMEA